MRRLSMRYQRDSHDDSDSDESFHCCGRPEDLLDSPPRPTSEPKKLLSQAYKEVFVPEDQDFFCYQSGLERQQREQSISTAGPSQVSGRAPVARVLGRTCSAESDKTLVAEEPVLVIKTGLNSPSPSKRMRARSVIAQLPPPRPKSRRASINIFRSTSVSRKPSVKTSPQKSNNGSKPARPRFSILQAKRRSTKTLYDISEDETRATCQQEGSSNGVSMVVEE
ncbi:hypothetical protein PTTG_27337 [Puccinia triticina 1-1 BBBD Race 1]|uniref:Uncharacterized protein n=1 Tax=Puccinia triticina (isolate 1-1 / race 1 (BBBD)) TaxID=630390 RepID=A0A180GL53_PUCT1|nr:hypothetical protein PTTG_27337 [Puccinia triticina 1-1 BBBD Race 1]